MDFYIKRPLMMHACVQYAEHAGAMYLLCIDAEEGKALQRPCCFFLAIYLRSHEELNEVAAGFLYGGISLQLELRTDGR
jgi:hypothetical protein